MEYGFSKTLYPSQEKTIKDVIKTIEENSMAIISSPTGTGKSLSLLCALTPFLKKNNDDLFDLFNTDKTKIYYCSRTHSQLAQVIKELKTCNIKYTSIVLGSRKVYCINKEVNKILNNDILTDRCKQLVQESNCEYYCNEYYSQETFDIEELKSIGENQKFCPYYYSKNRASECEIVFLPYNLLFTKEGRASLDITLKDKIIIIDEAHNIYETVAQLNSAELSWNDIKLISEAKGLNDDLNFIIKQLMDLQPLVSSTTTETATPVLSFIIDRKIAHFNMIEIADLIEKNKLAQKNDLKSIFVFSKFLRLLTFSDTAGRVFVNKNRIRFSCIDPKMYFEELKECKSVIFAGGTMEPIVQLKAVFPGILYYSYPPVNNSFISLIISETVNKKPINMTHGLRDMQIDDVINTLVAITNPVLNGGVIVFVPSQDFLQLFKRSGKVSNFRRKVFFEGELTFAEFKKTPEILVAVMGGSLSEGVNFSDDICRLLIVLGVPYPSKSLELLEKAKHIKEYETYTAMRTVNQTVGRAIRHKNDYAAILFVDGRYTQLKDKLSPWINLKTKQVRFSEALLQINSFLKDQKLKSLS
ncbi:DEAD H (Asp-Glu-Ala-Asp His) box helicase 11 [Glugoides intestinalis]